MAEEVHVWVKTEVINPGISNHARSLPGSFSDNDDSYVDWGWTYAVVVDRSETTLEVSILDEDNPNHGKNYHLNPDSFEKGTIVPANKHCGDTGFDDDREVDIKYYPDDLITLTHLHEPAVVHCLQQRYAFDKIYTATGSILLALNPFKQCKQLYNQSVMETYWKRGEAKMGIAAALDDDDKHKLPPHVYSVADDCFRVMIKRLNGDDLVTSSSSHQRSGVRARPGGPSAKATTCDQTILVSGESGSGKTVTTKFIMQYLAALSQRVQKAAKNGVKSKSSVSSHETAPPEAGHKNVEQQVLESNPILESFGNARTLRNDNSSRFGKFIEIKFSKTGTLIGASIETYLLEKVRLLTQAEGERNYHIFYELFCMSDEELEMFELHEYTMEDFNMVNKSGTFDRRDGVEDSETYGELRHAMDTMGFKEAEQQNALSIAAACLHGANLTFVGKNADESALDFENQHMEPFTKLLGLTPEALDKALCYLKIKAGKEYHTRTLPVAKAEKGLEALIKATYGALFTHLVRRINESITVKDSSAGKGRRPLMPTTGQATIGVLDIFGFESFKFNSFEQLCINYCNEALQHQFNMFVLEKEQEEYEREGIEWSFISFPGNQDVLDLIDKTGSGILRILDDQCRAPGTTDKTFCGDLYKKCTGHPRFEANHRQVGALKFGVRHYAGLVEYDTDGFVEKNRDELPREAADLLLSSTRPAIQNLAIILSDSIVGLGGPTTASTPAKQQSRSLSPKRPSGGGGTRVTVGGQFAQQLQELRNKIDVTAPHYVRCLKPNDILVPDHFDPLIISDQLRYAGVIEAVRVSRAGFPQRYSHAAFVSRYRVLGIAELKKAARSTRKTKPVEVLAQAVAFLVLEVDERRGGDGAISEAAQTAAPKNASDVAAALRTSGIQVGKTKVFLRRNAFDTLELLRTGKMAESAVQIQAISRRYVVRREYRSIRTSAVTIQSLCRMIRDKRRVEVVRRNTRATLIQTAWRRSVLRHRYRCIVSVSRWCQRMQRGRLGRRRYTSLNRQRKAVLIQKHWRRFPVARQYNTMKVNAIKIQCAIRCWGARKQHQEFRLRARDLGAAVTERDELKLRVRELQEQLTQQKFVANEAKNSNLTQELVLLQSKFDNVAAENESLRADVKQLQQKGKDQDKQTVESSKQLDELCLTVETQRKENEALTKTLANREKELLESRANTEQVLLLQSNVDKLNLKNEQLRSEIQSMQSKLEREATASEEATKLSKSLQCALDARVKENEELATRLHDVEIELQEARDNQIPAMKDSSDNGMSTLSTDKTNEWSLAEEVDQLRQEIFDLKEAAQSRESALSDKLKAAERTIEDMMKTSSTQLNNSANEASTSQLEELKRELNAAKRKHQNEIKEARDQIKHLERRLSEAEEDTSFTAERPSFTIIPSEASTQEILTLQDEVAQLNKELAAAKSLIESRSGQLDANSPEALALRFSELRRLSEACLEKDQEISRLKSQLDNCGSDDMSHISFSVQSAGSPEGVDLLRQDIRELKAQLAGRSIPEEGPESDDRSVSLEKKNKELRLEVESSKKLISQLELGLKEERERSMEDLNAFSRTLLEVDELRSSAQAMNRQLALAKLEATRHIKKQQPTAPGRRARNGGFHRHRALVDIPPLWGSKFGKKASHSADEQDVDEEIDDEEDEDEEDDFDDGAKSVIGGRPSGKQKRRGSGSSMFSAFF